MEILNCRVDGATLTAWKERFAPTVQPFFARRQFPLPRASGARWIESRAVREALTLCAHDTFATYEVSRAARHLLLLDERAFYSLSPDLRAALLQEQLEVGRGSVFGVLDLTELLTPSEREQVTSAADGGLLAWWPKLFGALSAPSQARVLASFVSEDRPPCRRGELSASRWRRVRDALPGVAARAGTFSAASGPNCFGAVIEGFTARRIAERTERPTFEAWLARRRQSPVAADEIGALLLWRDEQGALQHAALGLGNGYAFHKEAQTWWSPWQVVRLSEVTARWQEAGPMTSVRLAE